MAAGRHARALSLIPRMRGPVPLLALLVAGALAWFLLAGPEGPADPEAELGGTEEGGRSIASTPGLGGIGPATGDPDRGPTAAELPRSPRDITKPYQPRIGDVVIHPFGPDEQVIHADELTVRLEHTGNIDPFLGLVPDRDREEGTWTFDKVPIGTKRVVIFGDRFAITRTTVRVREGVKTYKKVLVDRAGTVAYTVKTPEDEIAPEVTLRLVDRQGRATLVGWQVRSQKLLTTRRDLTEITQAGQGLVLSVPPGSYTLVATTEDGRKGDATVRVEALDKVEANIMLR